MGALRTNRRRAAAAVVSLGLAGTAVAQEPGRLPSLVKPTAPGTELYYGMTKVAPAPAPPRPVVEMTRVPTPEVQLPKRASSPRSTSPSSFRQRCGTGRPPRPR